MFQVENIYLISLAVPVGRAPVGQAQADSRVYDESVGTRARALPPCSTCLCAVSFVVSCEEKERAMRRGRLEVRMGMGPVRTVVHHPRPHQRNGVHVRV